MTAAAQPQPTAMDRAIAFGKRILMSEYLILYLCIAMFVGLYVLSPTVATPRNISNLLSNMWPLLVIAVGQTFVLIIAGIDLSENREVLVFLFAVMELYPLQVQTRCFRLGLPCAPHSTAGGPLLSVG